MFDWRDILKAIALTCLLVAVLTALWGWVAWNLLDQ